MFDAYLSAVAEAPQRWRSIFMIADSFTPTLHKRVARVRARIVREVAAALPNSSTADLHADPELLAHHLVAALGVRSAVAGIPENFTHVRLLRSLDAMFTAIAGRFDADTLMKGVSIPSLTLRLCRRKV